MAPPLIGCQAPVIVVWKALLVYSSDVNFHPIGFNEILQRCSAGKSSINEKSLMFDLAEITAFRDILELFL